MSWRYFPALAVVTLSALLSVPIQTPASETTVVAEAQYLMADGDTLAQAEETVLQRSKRKAVEEAGMYLESTFLDVEKTTEASASNPVRWRSARSRQPSRKRTSSNRAAPSRMTALAFTHGQQDLKIDDRDFFKRTR